MALRQIFLKLQENRINILFSYVIRSKVSSLILNEWYKEFSAERTDRKKMNSYHKTLFFETFPVYHSLKMLLLEKFIYFLICFLFYCRQKWSHTRFLQLQVQIWPEEIFFGLNADTVVKEHRILYKAFPAIKFNLLISHNIVHLCLIKIFQIGLVIGYILLKSMIL